jgi:hypothetical protein
MFVSSPFINHSRFPWCPQKMGVYYPERNPNQKLGGSSMREQEPTAPEQAPGFGRGVLVFFAVLLVVIGQIFLFSMPKDSTIVIPFALWLGVAGVGLFLWARAHNPSAWEKRLLPSMRISPHAAWFITAVVLVALATITMLLFQQYDRRNYLPVITLWFGAAGFYLAGFKIPLPDRLSLQTWLRTHWQELLAIGLVTGLGDGGLVVTPDAELAETVRALRQYGWDANRISQHEGVNSRMDELQASVLRVKLRSLDAWNRERQSLAQMYQRLFSEMGLESSRDWPESVSVHHVFAIRHAQRDHLQKYLRGLAVETAIHYPAPLHLQPAFHALGYRSGSFPCAEKAAREVLSLPLFIGMTESECARVAESVAGFLKTPASRARE